MSKTTKTSAKKARKPEPPRTTVGPPISAGFEKRARTTPTGIPQIFDFASDEAAEFWINHGQPDLSDASPSGQGYTVEDVKAALKARGVTHA